MENDPVIRTLWRKLKHPAVVTFLILIGILIVMGLLVEYIRPDFPDPSIRMI